MSEDYVNHLQGFLTREKKGFPESMQQRSLPESRRSFTVPAREEQFTREQLEAALAELNFWVKPDAMPGHALRGKILHHLDAANDIITWMKRH